MTDHKFRRLLVLGDSIAAGIGDPVDGYPDRPWADQLASALGEVAYLNLGHPGARAAQIRAGQLEPALAWRPDLAFVAAGANDAIRRSFERPEHQAAVATELDHMVGRLSAGGALVVTFGCMDLGRTSFVPPDQRQGVSDRLRALDRLTEEITDRHAGLHVCFLDHPVVGDDVFSSDGLHANRRGHALIVTEVLAALGRRFAAVG